MLFDENHQEAESDKQHGEDVDRVIVLFYLPQADFGVGRGFGRPGRQTAGEQTRTGQAKNNKLLLHFFLLRKSETNISRVVLGGLLSPSKQSCGS